MTIDFQFYFGFCLILLWSWTGLAALFFTMIQEDEP